MFKIFYYYIPKVSIGYDDSKIIKGISYVKYHIKCISISYVFFFYAIVYNCKEIINTICDKYYVFTAN